MAIHIDLASFQDSSFVLSDPSVYAELAKKLAKARDEKLLPFMRAMGLDEAIVVCYSEHRVWGQVRYFEEYYLPDQLEYAKEAARDHFGTIEVIKMKEGWQQVYDMLAQKHDGKAKI